MPRPAKKLVAKPRRMATSANGGVGAAAVRASRAKADPHAKQAILDAMRPRRSRKPAPSPARPTRRMLTSNPARFAPIRRWAARSGGPAGADVAADAAGAGGREVVWAGGVGG